MNPIFAMGAPGIWSMQMEAGITLVCAVVSLLFSRVAFHQIRKGYIPDLSWVRAGRAIALLALIVASVIAYATVSRLPGTRFVDDAGWMIETFTPILLLMTLSLVALIIAFRAVRSTTKVGARKIINGEQTPEDLTQEKK